MPKMHLSKLYSNNLLCRRIMKAGRLRIQKSFSYSFVNWDIETSYFILLYSVNLMIKVILYWLSMIEYCVLRTSKFIFILYGGKAVRYQICPVHHSSIVTECCLRLNVVLKYFWAKLLMRLLKCPSKPTQDTSSIFTQC